MVESRSGGVQSIERSASVLMLLAQKPMTLTEVTNAARLSKTTTLRLLTALIHGGLVVRDPLNNRYQLGPACLTLGTAFNSGKGGFVALAAAEFAALHSAYPETLVVHVRNGHERVCVDEIPGASAIRYIATVGSSAPVYLGSAGRTLLSHLSSAELDALLTPMRMTLLTTGEAIDPVEFREELMRTKNDGFALSTNERVMGASAVSVPIFDQFDNVIAAISLLGPSERLPEELRRAAVPDLQKVSSAVSATLASIAQPDA